MTSLKMIEKVFNTTLPKSFTESWEGLLEDKLCKLKVYNFGEFYLLNEAAITALNTKKEPGVTLSSALKDARKLIDKWPLLHDYVPIAIEHLYIDIYCFIAFKKTKGVIADESLYFVYSLTTGIPENFHFKQIASKYTDILGDGRYAELAAIAHAKDSQLTITATDHIYSHLFERYTFFDGYLDTIAKQLNKLFSTFDDVKFFDEGGHTLYCESGRVKSVIFDTGDKVMQPIENTNIQDPEKVIYNNLKRVLAGKLGPYMLYIFQWRFFSREIAETGLGLSKNNNIDPLISQYGMMLRFFE
ncbi:hypothetical protein [Chitinophaga filiformis]|uniref:Uncharacterized protein n=1 Tax=Chitinophaga filiformis TaxID=104663 RepID=A0A1G7I9J8_CHIFI|nr:hypothetical protein [Chitinophaga filiformis]SDF09390.1 hypothetical protein SAMN04488121_101767 [Chitinophaga filiformis]